MRYKRIITAYLLLLLAFSLNAQKKVEKERRVDREEVPEEALEWFEDAYEDVYEDAGKVRWYFERSNQGESYEAKLKWKGHKHSVEFSTTGVIEDIEILISTDELPEQTRETLLGYFDTHYKKYRIRKIQRQLNGESDDLEDVIDEDETEDILVRYEIEFYGKTAKQKELYEGLFDAGGHLINRRVIKLRPTNNLIY
jgi:hypothetical protein